MIVCNRYRRIVERVKPDIVISFLPEPCMVSGLYRKRNGISLIGSERCNPYYQYRNAVYKFLCNLFYSKADRFVFQTEGARDFFQKHIRENSCIIGNPVRELQLPVVSLSKKEKIAAVGRFTPEKNYPLLISSWNRVHDAHPEFELVIYGRYEESDEAIIMIKELNLEDSITLAGQVDNVEELINTCYAFVLTSSSEGMPNALMEAMSIGLPVVATDCPSGGPRQLIDNGVNGILVPNKDEDAVVTALIKLIEEPHYAEKLGDKAREICTEYSDDVIVNKWIDLIEKIAVRGK